MLLVGFVPDDRRRGPSVRLGTRSPGRSRRIEPTPESRRARGGERPRAKAPRPHRDRDPVRSRVRDATPTVHAEPRVLARRGVGRRFCPARLCPRSARSPPRPRSGSPSCCGSRPPIGGPERIRVVPLLFGAVLAPLAYVLGRTLDPGSDWRAWALGIAGVVIPVTLRHDLKQYTVDAFCALLLVVLVARAERSWSVRRLAALTTVATASRTTHQSHIRLGGTAGARAPERLLLLRGRRREAWWTAGGAALAAISFGAVYLVFDAPVRTSRLVHYWDAYYVPTDRTSNAIRFIHTRWGLLPRPGRPGWTPRGRTAAPPRLHRAVPPGPTCARGTAARAARRIDRPGVAQAVPPLG